MPDLVESGGADNNRDGRVDNFIDINNDGLSDILITVPVQPRDLDADGTSDHLDLDSDNDGVFDITAAGSVDSNGDGRVDNFTDTDGDGFQPPVELGTARPGPIITGVKGSGCALSTVPAAFDPLLLLLLILALGYLTIAPKVRRLK